MNFDKTTDNEKIVTEKAIMMNKISNNGNNDFNSDKYGT